LHPKSHVCVRKVGKRGAKEKELNVVVVRSWYMEHVIQLDLDRAYLPVRDILLQPDREISVKLRGKKTDLERATLEHTGKRSWLPGCSGIWARREGRRSWTGSPWRALQAQKSNTKNRRAVRECSGTLQGQTKKRFEEVPEDVATARRTFVCGEVGVLHPGGCDWNGGGGGEEVVGGGQERGRGCGEAAKCSGEWREEGNKRRVLAGRQRAAWREEQVGPGPRVGRDVVGLGLLEARVG